MVGGCCRSRSVDRSCLEDDDDEEEEEEDGMSLVLSIAR